MRVSIDGSDRRPVFLLKAPSPPAPDAYGNFAYAYDAALGRRFARAITELLEWSLEIRPDAQRTHLDLACGTGLTLDWFLARGYQSVGVDGSIPMLAQVRSRGSVAAYDFRALAIRATFSWITCLYDSLNHLLERRELVETFSSVRSLMDDDSLFLFDMNQPAAYHHVWATREPYLSSDESHHLSMHTSYSPRTRIGRADLTGWTRVNGRKFDIQETHRQRAYSEKEVIRSLREAGLEPRQMIPFDPFHPDGLFAGGDVKFFFIVGKS